jgi:hypothetical protein
MLGASKVLFAEARHGGVTVTTTEQARTSMHARKQRASQARTHPLHCTRTQQFLFVSVFS